jgi:hypothetical protein
MLMPPGFAMERAIVSHAVEASDCFQVIRGRLPCPAVSESTDAFRIVPRLSFGKEISLIRKTFLIGLIALVITFGKHRMSALSDLPDHHRLTL